MSIFKDNCQKFIATAPITPEGWQSSWGWQFFKCVSRFKESSLAVSPASFKEPSNKGVFAPSDSTEIQLLMLLLYRPGTIYLPSPITCIFPLNIKAEVVDLTCREGTGHSEEEHTLLKSILYWWDNPSYMEGDLEGQIMFCVTNNAQTMYYIGCQTQNS